MARRTTKSLSDDAADEASSLAETPETAELRADIEKTRADMAKTVSAIEERLSPAHIKEQVAGIKEAVLGEYHEAKQHIKEDIVHELKDAKDALRGGIDEVKDRIEDGFDHAKTAAYDATVGKVSDMMDDARETVSEAGGSLLDTIRANPIPAAMIAVGVGWLFLGSRKPEASSRRVIDRSGRALGRAAHVVGDTASEYGYRAREGASDIAHRVQDEAGNIYQRVQDGAGDIAHRVQDGAGELAHAVTDRAEHVATEAREVSLQAVRGARGAARTVGRQAVRAERGLESAYDSSPLAFGAVAAVVGAAVGLSLPSTSQEDEWLGEVKDRLLSEAQVAAREALHGAEEKIDHVASLAATAQKSVHRMTAGLSSVDESERSSAQQAGV